MKFVKTLALAVVGSAAISSAAIAAENNMDAHAFDWDRYYIGAYGGIWADIAPLAFSYERAGFVAGKNFAVGPRFVLGVEGAFGLWDFDDLAVEVGGTVRAGVLATDTLLIYALGGLYYDFYAEEFAGLAGGGVEFAIAPHVTYRTEMAFWLQPGSSPELSLTGGFTWQIDRH